MGWSSEAFGHDSTRGQLGERSLLLLNIITRTRPVRDNVYIYLSDDFRHDSWTLLTSRHRVGESRLSLLAVVLLMESPLC